MTNDNGFGHRHASDQQRRELAEEFVDQAWSKIRGKCVDAVYQFISQPLSPQTLHVVEMTLLVVLRSLGRELLEVTIQSLEPANPKTLPDNLHWQCGGYRKRNDKKRNPNIATMFGNIVLWRTGYRSWQSGETGIFPLECMLGLVEGVSPGLLDFLGKTYAATGSSQRATLDSLKYQCGVSMGAPRLLRCMDSLSLSMEKLRQSHQVDAILECLRVANESSGGRKPVLSLGRDGITLRENKHSFFEVATAGTLSVYDRAGKRLQTIYLGWIPEYGQGTMDAMITNLLEELFTRWEGPLPRLAYVTDSGSNEVGYFEKVLRKMKHPLTGAKLEWHRVADFYHASERVWSMASALFKSNQDQQRVAWARKMLKKLKQPNGASRVLHSAAALVSRRKLGKARRKTFGTAYRYIQARTQHMRYDWCRQYNIPRGSGVTEAACKTLFTQRLKLSGMRWSEQGARRILGLRTVLLSKTWDTTFQSHLKDLSDHGIRPYDPNSNSHLQNAA